MDRPAFFARFTPDQLRAGFARNAAGLRQMQLKAERTGRNVNGFTADYLRAKADDYLRLSTADDAAIQEHIARAVPPYETRKALRDATLAVGRDAS